MRVRPHLDPTFTTGLKIKGDPGTPTEEEVYVYPASPLSLPCSFGSVFNLQSSTCDESFDES